ncbi:MAG: Rieske 2Fe-2S domain-containing protein [Novosphingobium sp.]|nr:Rieske 2Fe-2S domain-containing protein [Novosphingobium sp.]
MASNGNQRFDLPLPFGWFAVARSEELTTGEIMPLEYCGTEFVLWRGEDGAARALDATCPHLGAHLGYDSEVIGNDLRCPFHHWQFTGEGIVTNIPYAKAIPPKLKRPCERGWQVYEDMGMIFVWWHPHKAKPLWELSPVSEIAEEKWHAVEYKQWIVDIPIQELTENGADIAHFAPLHGTKSPPVPEFKAEGYTRISSVATKMPTSKGVIDGKITVRAPGPGVSFTRFHGITEMLLMQMHTPIDKGHTLLRHQYFVPPQLEERKVNVTNALVRETSRQIEQDIRIWKHKKYLAEPTLVNGDGPILAYREFFKRYYA